MFERGSTYSRNEIHALIGGGTQDYLPHKNGRVVCGCFKPELQPEVPGIVLSGVGPGIERWARVFREQRDPVPIFLKRAINRWEYVGQYVVDRFSEDAAVIAEQARKTGRGEITTVLYLREVR